MHLSEEEHDFAERLLQDPAFFVEHVLGWSPWGIQAEILRSPTRYRKTRVASCHGIGKSTVAAGEALHFVTTHKPAMCLATATSARQVEGILCKEMRKQWARAKYPLGGKMTNTRWSFMPTLPEIENEGDRWFWGFTAPESDPDRFAGFHSDEVMVIIDEAAGVRDEVYEGLEAAMSGGNARMLEIGNPTDSMGQFGQGFNSDDGANLFRVSCFDTPNFTAFGITLDDIRENTWEEKITGPLPRPYLVQPIWVRDRWVKWTRNGADEEDPRWMARCMARFPAAGAQALVPAWWVDEAFERWKELERSSGWNEKLPKRLGCDVARFGSDGIQRSEYLVGQGIRRIIPSPKQKLTATAGEIYGHLAEDPTVTEARIDADGLGQGVYDMVAERTGGHVVEIHGGVSPMNKIRFVNRRAEMLWDLREALNPQLPDPIALPPDPELREELTNIRWELNSKNKIVIEAKVKIKARIGRSPDKADSAAYAVCRVPDGEGGIDGVFDFGERASSLVDE